MIKSLLTLLIIFNTSYGNTTQDQDKSNILSLGMGMSEMRSMLKSYILIGAKTIYEDDEKPILKSGFVNYETLLNKLSADYLHDNKIQKSIRTSEKAWVHVRKAMTLAIQGESPEKMKEGALFIHAKIRTVIKQMEYMKEILLSQSNLPYKASINASIEIAASARRLSAHYMMSLWHLKDPTIVKHWNKGIAIYTHSLEILKNTSLINHTHISTLVHSLELDLTYFIKMSKKPKIYYPLINRKAEKTFHSAQELTEIILNLNTKK